MDRIEPTFGTNLADDLASKDLHAAEKDQVPPVKLAGPGRRYVGQILDALIAWGLFIVCLHSLNKLQVTSEHAVLIAIALAAVYLIFSDALPKGQSFGKKLLGMTVVCKDSGKYCSLWQSFVRNIMTPVIGIIDAIFILSKRRQRLGDMAAGTIVIRK